jgi:hypothetical protein
LQHHAASGAELTVRCADDFACDIGAGNVRERQRDSFHAAALPEIEMIQRARANANQCLAGTGDGIIGVFVAENLGSSMRVETNGFQKSSFNT